MKRLLLGLALSVGLAATLAAEPSSESLLKARIVQLEAQLQDAQRRILLLQAQLSEAQQPAIAKELQEKRLEAEKALGCVGRVNWNLQQPDCIPDDPKPAAK